MKIAPLIDDLSRLDARRHAVMRQISGNSASVAELDRERLKGEILSLNHRIKGTAERINRALKIAATSGEKPERVRVGPVRDAEIKAFLAQVEEALGALRRRTHTAEAEGAQAEGAAAAQRERLAAEDERARSLQGRSEERVQSLEEEDQRLAEEMRNAEDDRERGRHDLKRLDEEVKKLDREKERVKERLAELAEYEVRRRKERDEIEKRRADAEARLAEEGVDERARQLALAVKSKAEEGIRQIDKHLKDGVAFQRSELEALKKRLDEDRGRLQEATAKLKKRLAEIDEFIERSGDRRREIQDALAEERRRRREIDDAAVEIDRGLEALEA